MASRIGSFTAKTVQSQVKKFSEDPRVRRFTKRYLENPITKNEKALTMVTYEFAKKEGDTQVVNACLDYFLTCNQ